MKAQLQKIIILFFWAFHGILLSDNKKIDQLITEEIRYSAPGANEVYLVWGINGWKFQNSALWPNGTHIKGKLTYTLMKMKNSVFSTKLKVPVGTTIDYVFWISKGPLNSPADIWDANTEPFDDYHLYAHHPAITLIESSVKVIPKEDLSLLHFSKQLLILTCILLIILVLLKKFWLRVNLPKPGALTIFLSMGGILTISLLLLRISIVKKGWELYYDPLKLMDNIGIGFYDFVYSVILTSLCGMLYFLFRNYRRTRNVLMYVFISLCILSIVAGIINIRVVQILGRPFNYRWLYYSDFLFSSDAKAAMSVNFSLDYILNITALCLAIIIGAFLLIRLIGFLLSRWKIRKTALTALLLLNLGYFILAQKTVASSNLNPDKLVNPIAEFLISSNPFASNIELFTVEIPDSLKIPARKRSDTKLHSERTGKIKNVILIVLESTPAEYIQLYNNQYNVTPELASHFSSSLIVENMYAHAPATTKAFTTILSSIYPWLSYTCITEEHPDIDIPTLSSELKRNGFRTGYFNSGDNNFQGQNNFLASRKFDTIADRNSIHCSHDAFAAKEQYWDPNDGISDACTGKALIEWVTSENEKPFFAMMWTYQTHYPYYFSGKEYLFDASNPSLNSYLNALHEGDQMIGNILSELRKKGLYESTLVVVAGDHGEAFGRHDQIIHANKIYEENVHIPCILINPAFTGERNNALCGQADIAPTIMSALNLPISNQWQGKSLFANEKDERVYFFSPWSDYLFGYREGKMKYIFNATKNSAEVYDLEADPTEKVNLAPNMPESDLSLYYLRLAAWVQYQNNFIKGIFARKQKNKKE